MPHDGYPTEEELAEIRAETDVRKWFDLVRACWWCPEFGFHEVAGPEDVVTFRLSTGGWSGNEEVIAAMKENEHWLWKRAWESTRRGGHYEFVVGAE